MSARKAGVNRLMLVISLCHLFTVSTFALDRRVLFPLIDMPSEMQQSVNFQIAYSLKSVKDNSHVMYQRCTVVVTYLKVGISEDSSGNRRPQYFFHRARTAELYEYVTRSVLYETLQSLVDLTHYKTISR